MQYSAKEQTLSVPEKARKTSVQFLLVIKFTSILLLAACLQVSARVGAQVTLSEKKASLEKVLQSIKKQSGYDLVYDVNMLRQKGNPVDIIIKNGSVDQALKMILDNQPLLTYEISSKNIIFIKEREVVKKKEPEISTPVLSPVGIDISGRVVGADGAPLEGAYIKIKSNGKSVVSDRKGSFTIKGIDKSETLIVSFTGFLTKETKVNNQLFLSIKLDISTSELDEIHTVAYGTTTKRFDVGSVAKVTSEDISQQAVENPIQALEGRVAGLVVTQNSGVPGASFNIQIRGQNTIRGLTSTGFPQFDNPLFIIDGVPFAPQNNFVNQFSSLGNPSVTSNAAFNTNDNPRGMTAFNSLNPEDIESIEILKDANATAIYGSRGANGVILITTKKGKEGKTKFTTNVRSGGSWVGNTLPMLNTQQYLAMRREAYANDGIIPTAANAPDLFVYDTTKFTNWNKFLNGRTAHTTDANMSLSGGTSETQFRIGLGYHHEDYIYPGEFSNNRVSVSTSLTHQSLNRKLAIELSANYSYDQNNSSAGGSGGLSPLKASVLPPNYPDLLNSDGSINWLYKGVVLNTNPLSFLRQPYISKNSSLNTHFQITYKPIQGLSLRASFGYSSLNSVEHDEMPKNSLNPYNPSAGNITTADFGVYNPQSWIIEPQAEYTHKVWNGKLNVLVGSSIQQSSSAKSYITATNYTNDALMGSTAGAANLNAFYRTANYKYDGIFARVNYIFSDKYIFNLTGKKDGSSRFGPGNQFGTFGSIGAGWIFGDEIFIKKNIGHLISHAKVSANYGTSGNDNIGDYQYVPRWSATGGITYLGSPGYIPQNLYNPDYEWTVNRQLNIALDFGLFNDAIVGSISWHQNRCGNQLLSYALPYQTGFNNVTANTTAVVQNQGWEISLSSTNIKTKYFSWKTNLNLTPAAKNMLLAFPNLASSSYANTYVIGQSLSIKKGNKYIGVNDTTGLFQFLTTKGTSTYLPNGDDSRQVLGNLDPLYYGGLGNTFTYKRFQLNIFMDFRKQPGHNYLSQLNPIGFSATNVPVLVLNRWQKTGDKSNLERFTASSSSAAYKAYTAFNNSDGAYTDASFIRIKTINLSYNLADKWVKRIKAQGCSLYISAQNLFTITGYKGGDPESQAVYELPPLRTIVAGLNISF